MAAGNKRTVRDTGYYWCYHLKEWGIFYWEAEMKGWYSDEGDRLDVPFEKIHEDRIKNPDEG